MPLPTVALAFALLAAAPAARPLYYDHPMEHADLDDRSVEELRLMRKAIHARAELSAADVKNLARIDLSEPLAKARADLRRLVPGWGSSIKLPPRTDCEANAKGVVSSKKLERRLATLMNQLRWTDLDFCGDGPWPEATTKKSLVRLGCMPDLDGDGAPESIVSIRYPYVEPYGETVTRTFLISGKGPTWRAVAPLGVDGTCPGVEGSTSTAIRIVKLASGKVALAVETESGGGGDCDEEITQVSVFTWKEGKLIPVATFMTDGPTCVD